jgi:hypothetical protein
MDRRDEFSKKIQATPHHRVDDGSSDDFLIF